MTQAGSMLAMQWQGPGQALRQVRLPIPACGEDEVLLRVLACGVCRTDLHIVDAELPPHRLPVVPGHEIVGELVQAGARVDRLRWASAWACHGWAVPAGIAHIAAQRARTCATSLCLRAVTAMGAMRSMRLPMRATVSRSRRGMTMRMRRHCCAPA